MINSLPNYLKYAGLSAIHTYEVYQYYIYNHIQHFSVPETLKAQSSSRKRKRDFKPKKVSSRSQQNYKVSLQTCQQPFTEHNMFILMSSITRWEQKTDQTWLCNISFNPLSYAPPVSNILIWLLFCSSSYIFSFYSYCSEFCRKRSLMLSKVWSSQHLNEVEPKRNGIKLI